MHITGGYLKGIHLTDVRKITNYTRPTSSRLRENLFNILMHNFPCLLKGHFIDCFAGTGSVGLEALSRGAQHVTFIENKPIVLHVLKKNINKCQVANQITIITNIKKLQADIIFFDPPYNNFFLPKNSDASLYIAQAPSCYLTPYKNSIIHSYGNNNLLFWGNAVTNLLANKNHQNNL